MAQTNFINRHLNLPRRVRSFALNSVPIALGHRYNVSVSHKHKIIWYRVAKVGTRSIITLISDSDSQMILNYPKWRSLNAGSMSSYTAVSFVRNPYDRLVSAWKNKVVDSNLFRLEESLHRELQDFDRFVEYVSQYDIRNADVHLRPQYRLVDTGRVNSVGKMESFEEDCEKIFSEAGVDVSGLERKNASSQSRKPALEYFSESSIGLVNKLYAKDFEIFEYSKV